MTNPSHREFYYYGDFYKLDGRCCRSTLEIVDSPVPVKKRNQLLSCRPAILVVMMNPGTSHAIEGGNGTIRQSPKDIKSGVQLVPTCPDDTQECIAEVMRCKDFRHARVLNLSDIRNADSKKFLKDLSCYPSRHSVFSKERTCELRDRLNPTSGIVIVAWGTDKRLHSLATAALKCLRHQNLCVHGCEGEKKEPFFMHPARRKRKWPKWILCNWPSGRR